MKFLPLIALPLFLFACSEPGPRQVAEKYTSALLEKNWGEACRWIEEESRQRSEEISGRGCEEDLRRATSSWIDESRSRITLYKLYKKSNLVVFKTNVYSETITLRRGDDGWRVTFFEK